MRTVKLWPLASEYCVPTLNPDPEHVLLLAQKDSVAMPYGHSPSVLFKMVNLKEGIGLSCGDNCQSAWLYLQGKKNDCIRFSFLTTNGIRKNFSLNTQISGIVVDEDVAIKENSQLNHYNVKQNEGAYTFYKIMKTKDGNPLVLRAMRLAIGNQGLILKDCIRPVFIPTDASIEVSPESVQELKESGIFENFSLKKWAFKEKKDSDLIEQDQPEVIKKNQQFPKKKGLPAQRHNTTKSFFTSNTFYCVSILSIFYTVGSLLYWLKHRFK